MGGWDALSKRDHEARRYARAIDVLLDEIDRLRVEAYNLRCEVKRLGGAEDGKPHPLPADRPS